MLHPEVLDEGMTLDAIQNILLELIAGCRRIRLQYTIDGQPRRRGTEWSPEVRGPWAQENDLVEVPIARFSRAIL